MGKHPKRAVLGFVILIAVLGLASWRLLAPLAPLARAGHCDLSSQQCLISLGGQELEVEIIPRRPAPGEELLLILKSASESSPHGAGALTPEEITADFSMPAMDMGEHVMKLETTELGTLEGRITLPSCPMGQPLWQVSIRVGQVSAPDRTLHVGVLHVGK